MRRVLIVADISNLFYCVNKRFQARVDYKRYLEIALNGYELYRAIAYGAQMGGEAEKFRTVLHHLGYETKFKTPNIYPSEEEGREIRKADWDVGIAIDVVRLIKRFDVLVLGSADGDMAPLVQWVKDSGAYVHIFASGISRQLKDVADTHQEIDESVILQEVSNES